MKIKVKIHEDELYPYYTQAKPKESVEKEIEFTEDEYASWQKTLHNFEIWQEIIAKRIFIENIKDEDREASKGLREDE